MKFLLLTLLTTVTAGRKDTLASIPNFIDYTGYKPPGLRSYDPSSPNSSCYSPLHDSDANNDGSVNQKEYIDFIQSLEPRVVVGVKEFKDLAFVLKVNFIYLSCLCEDGRNNCCRVGDNGLISTAGTDPNDSPTEAQLRYLDTVCSTTQASIDHALKGIPPTTLQPTELQSIRPTLMPTKFPTDFPSFVPSAWPSQNPTEFPSNAPSFVPSTWPSPIPTESPTNAPVVTVPDSIEPTYVERTKSPTVTTSAPFPIAMKTPPPSNEEVIPPTSSNTTLTVNPTTAPSITVRAIGGESTDNSTTTLSSRGIAGIVLASVAVIIAGIILTRKRERENEEDPSLEFKSGDLEMGDLCGAGEDGSTPGPSPTNADADSSDASPDLIPHSPERQLKPLQKFFSPFSSPKNSHYSPQKLDLDNDSNDSPTRSGQLLGTLPYSPQALDLNEDSDDSSSSAGQSGWSSSQGLSSLNTASFDAGETSFDTGEDTSLLTEKSPAALAGSALAAIGVASAMTYNIQKNSFSQTKDGRLSAEEGTSEVNREDLDAAIESGDWAAVGATAALLATTEHNNSENRVEVNREDLDAAIESGDWAAVGATAALLATTEHSSSKNRQYNQRTSPVLDMNESRKNHLDKLVKAGDWGGVVLVAAQVEDQSSDQESNDDSQDQVLDDASEPSLLARGRSGNLDSIRTEVENLVRKIVPDELDNIDEMMIQFEGREHELIETLKTMQERSEAQRARAAVEESATFEAKTRGHDKTDGEDSVSSSASKSLLEQAMEKGDWQAVGQAAAMMGGDSIMIEDDSLDRSHHSSISSSLSDSRSHSASRGSMLSRDKSERIQRLDSLIAVGDWAGIVAVASQYQAIDEEVEQNPPIDAALTTDEERDALAQAEMWHAIAEQSKQDILSASQGAQEAADWAISRSLKKHSVPFSSTVDQPDTKVSQIETYEDDQSV